LLIGAACLLLARGADAQIEMPGEDNPSEGSLIAECKSVAPGGDIWVGLRITMKPTWHVYWTNPGDSGLAPSLEWTLPKGVTASPLVWAAPHRIPQGPLMMYGYDDELLLPVRLRVPKDFKAKKLRVGVSASWLTCADVCLQGEVTTSIEIPVAAGEPKKDPEWAPLFDKTRRAVPKPVPDRALSLRWGREGDRITFGITIDRKKLPIGDSARAYFFPAKGGVLDHMGKQKLTVEKNRALLDLPPAESLKKNRIPRLRGVLVIWEGKARRAYAVDLPGPPAKQ
jgi:thiol:disulfide interchange protein DsbD